jgi:dTMP kinase
VDQLHALMIGREPDLTILIDMDPGLGLNRALSRQGSEERFEDFGADLQERMRAGFLALAKEFPERFRVIDGARDIEAVANDVRAVAEAHLAV